MIKTVLTKKERDSFTPEEIILQLKQGNRSFIKQRHLAERDAQFMVLDSNSGQAPKAAILSCIDSRVPVEEVFDQGIGDVFVARVAGNIVDEDVLGSIEYACLVAGSKVVLVMGHEHCGAVKSAIQFQGESVTKNIDALLSKIDPAIGLVPEGDFPKETRTYDNPEFLQAVCDSNVKNTIEEIRKRSEPLRKLEESKDIVIVGAVYHMQTGEVKFFG